MHSGDVSPALFAHVPGAQGPLHSRVASPGVLPNRPTGQSMGASDPAGQNEPMLHSTLPAGVKQKDPGGQGRESLVERGRHSDPGTHGSGATFGALQNEPAGQSASRTAPPSTEARHREPGRHSPEHALVVRPAVAPYRPEAQGVGVVEFAPHQKPGSHAPEHAGVSSPGALPYRPAAQGTDVELVEPGGHQYPGLQSPLHDSDAKPIVFPNVPAAHRAHADELFAPLLGLVVPSGQLTQSVEEFDPVRAL